MDTTTSTTPTVPTAPVLSEAELKRVEMAIDFFFMIEAEFNPSNHHTTKIALTPFMLFEYILDIRHASMTAQEAAAKISAVIELLDGVFNCETHRVDFFEKVCAWAHDDEREKACVRVHYDERTKKMNTTQTDTETLLNTGKTALPQIPRDRKMTEEEAIWYLRAGKTALITDEAVRLLKVIEIAQRIPLYGTSEFHLELTVDTVKYILVDGYENPDKYLGKLNEIVKILAPFGFDPISHCQAFFEKVVMLQYYAK